MAKRLVRALAVAIALIPGAAFGAGLSFLSARDAAARASERDAVERERIRKDIDQLRADVRNNPTWSQP